ncbi:hypothetical protein J6590_070036 [Homalodisca vitripennis]|nr:hypothetical protein J6590_070036 [Homalodisca vitripennis]
MLEFLNIRSKLNNDECLPIIEAIKSLDVGGSLTQGHAGAVWWLKLSTAATTLR